jgi:hypothetical protein
MSQAVSRNSTIDTLKMADRLNDIARRLDVAAAAANGIDALHGGGDHVTDALATFVRELGDQVRGVSHDIHPTRPMAAAEGEGIEATEERT